MAGWALSAEGVSRPVAEPARGGSLGSRNAGLPVVDLRDSGQPGSEAASHRALVTAAVTVPQVRVCKAKWRMVLLLRDAAPQKKTA